jgi:hypothetical protein
MSEGATAFHQKALLELDQGTVSKRWKECSRARLSQSRCRTMNAPAGLKLSPKFVC